MHVRLNAIGWQKGACATVHAALDVSAAFCWHGLCMRQVPVRFSETGMHSVSAIMCQSLRLMSPLQKASSH